MIRKIALLVTVVWCITLTNGWAQQLEGSAPGAVQKRAEETREYFELQKKLKEKEKPSEEAVIEKEKAEEKTPPVDDRKIILIREIVTTPSEILSDDEIKTITEPYEGSMASLKDLFDVVKEINDLYKSRHYITARAILPPQKVENGTVKIKLIEAHLGLISVEDNNYTRESYFTRRISLQSGDLLELKTLEDDLVYFNTTNDVQIKAELKPGKEFGTTDCIVRASEPRNYDVQVFADNAGRKDVGRERIGILVRDNSLFGIRDPFTVSATYADGTTGASASYNVPINARGTRIGASYDYNQIKLRSGALEELDISGNSYDASVSLNHPLVATPRFQLNGFLAAHKKKSVTELAEVKFFDVKVITAEYGIDFNRFDNYGFWYSLHKLTNGFDRWGGGDKTFFKYNLYLTRLVAFKNDVVMLFRGSGQLSDSDQLPSTEQFQLGGLSTVRGYSEGLLIGDEGYFTSAELHLPIPVPQDDYSIKFTNKVKGVIFVDHGAVFPYKAGESINHDDFLTSVGFGFILNFSKYLTGRLNWGVPLGNREKEGQNNIKFHFYLQSEFF